MSCLSVSKAIILFLVFIVLMKLVKYKSLKEKSQHEYLTTDLRHLVTLNYNKSLHGVELDEMDKRLYSKEAPLTFLKKYKNPCWLERLTDSYMSEYRKTAFNSGAEDQIAYLAEVYNERLKTNLHPWRIRCLPYFYLMGVTKSGTTDFYYAILKHPDVHGPWIKEPMYWNRGRYPQGVVVHKVDGSSYLFWEDHGWMHHPDNQGLTEPKYTTPMAIYAAQSQAKLIVLFRHPVDRIYSAYAMNNNNPTRSPQHFDLLARQAIIKYETCFREYSIRACVYNASLSQETFPITLKASMYAVYLQDWLAVFPREQLLVIKSEDYYNDRIATFRDVFTFLDIRGFDNTTVKRIEQTKPKFHGRYQPMLQTTRDMLDTFMKPFNTLLENILHRLFWN